MLTPGKLLVRVKACAINYPDVLTIQDKYQFKIARPFAPGAELAGIVEEVGEGVTGWSAGDRVIAFVRHGGLAEKALVDAAMAVRLPDEFSYERGSALLLTFATTIHGLLDRGRLREGETLLVLGAGGGVGLAAVALGKAFGARVVAAASSPEKRDAARECGADETLIYATNVEGPEGVRALADQFKQAVGSSGADVIYDPVGGLYADAAMRSISWGGRYLVVGFPAGIPTLPLNLPLLKGCQICGVHWGEFARRSPVANAAHVGTLFRLWSEGKIEPRISQVLPFEQAPEAIALLECRKAVGKVVVTMS